MLTIPVTHPERGWQIGPAPANTEHMPVVRSRVPRFFSSPGAIQNNVLLVTCVVSIYLFSNFKCTYFSLFLPTLTLTHSSVITIVFKNERLQQLAVTGFHINIQCSGCK